jgi:gluconokinase
MRTPTDEEIFEWALSNGRKPSDEEVEIWNAYLFKRCWRDEYTNRLHFRLQQAGMPIEAALTMFDFIDLDEGRTLRRQP